MSDSRLRTCGKAVAAGAIAAVVVLSPVPAKATATGAMLFAEVCTDGIVPVCGDSQQFTGRVEGKGRTITTQGAFFSPFTSQGFTRGRVCNWRIDFTIKDASGRNLRAPSIGTVKKPCTSQGMRKLVREVTLLQDGEWCAVLHGRLHQDGPSASPRELARVCHQITP